MSKYKSHNKQGRKNCLVCGWQVPDKSPWPLHCSIGCWGKDNGEPPDPPEYDPYDPKNFEGYPVGK